MTARLAAIETLRHPDYPRLLHVVLHDDGGHSGLGETFGAASTIAELLHGDLAPRLIGLPLEPGALRDAATRGTYGARRGPGAAGIESAAASAIDLAAWDALARRRGVTLAAVLGSGAEPASLYATCLDPDHAFGLGGPPGPYRDHSRSLADPADLARELAAAGYAMMKVWPFTPGGDHDRALELVRAAVETHALPVVVDLAGALDAQEAIAVALALDALGLAWIEDPLPADALAGLPALRARLATPICAGEHLALGGHDALIAAGGVDIVHVDLAWAGGISEALRVAGVAAEAGLTATFHDCSGPIVLAASCAAARNLPNVALVECARTYLEGPYPAIATTTPDGCGHGLALRPDERRTSRISRTTPPRSPSPRTDAGLRASRRHRSA